MKDVTQYLKRARELEALADAERNPALTKKLHELPREYFKLAAEPSTADQVGRLRSEFGSALLGVLIGGSRSRSEGEAHSDIDFSVGSIVQAANLGIYSRPRGM
jgi:hypothetical protein